jgi:16S rRNA (cytidine1402-2'-O)-methyltransferase
MNNNETGKLYLLPTTLGSFNTSNKVLPDYNTQIIHSLDIFVVEQVRTARRFLSFINHPVSIDDITFKELNKHTDEAGINSYLEPAFFGKSVGLLSEAGTPCIADPGAAVVRIAHENGIQVIPLIGPNSIILSLMASGFNGQNFTFHGYLPVDKQALTRKLKDIEQTSRKKNQTQIFIETPYRNNRMLNAITNTCSPATQLCIATDVTLSSESITTLDVSDWKKMSPDINKKPSVFLIFSSFQ